MTTIEESQEIVDIATPSTIKVRLSGREIYRAVAQFLNATKPDIETKIEAAVTQLIANRIEKYLEKAALNDLNWIGAYGKKVGIKKMIDDTLKDRLQAIESEIKSTVNTTLKTTILKAIDNHITEYIDSAVKDAIVSKFGKGN